MTPASSRLPASLANLSSRFRSVEVEDFTRKTFRSKRATLGLAVLGTLALFALFAEVLASETPLAGTTDAGFELFPNIPAENVRGVVVRAPIPYGPSTRAGVPLSPPSAEHWLGVDQEGRDVLARAIHGARMAFGTSLIVALLGVLGGGATGALASQLSRRFGQSLERAAQAVDAFPALVVVALFRAVEGRSSALSVVVGATIVQWAAVARLVRAEVQRLGTEDFILSARALGASPIRILVRHMLPHLGPSLASSAALGVGAVVMLEATLSFLGLGPPITGASWGEMLAEGARHPDHAALFYFPAALLSITIGAAYLVAEGIREAADPIAMRMREPHPDTHIERGVDESR